MVSFRQSIADYVTYRHAPLPLEPGWRREYVGPVKRERYGSPGVQGGLRRCTSAIVFPAFIYTNRVEPARLELEQISLTIPCLNKCEPTEFEEKSANHRCSEAISAEVSVVVSSYFLQNFALICLAPRYAHVLTLRASTRGCTEH